MSKHWLWGICPTMDMVCPNQNVWCSQWKSHGPHVKVMDHGGHSWALQDKNKTLFKYRDTFLCLSFICYSMLHCLHSSKYPPLPVFPHVHTVCICVHKWTQWYFPGVHSGHRRSTFLCRQWELWTPVLSQCPPWTPAPFPVSISGVHPPWWTQGQMCATRTFSVLTVDSQFHITKLYCIRTSSTMDDVTPSPSL